MKRATMKLVANIPRGLKILALIEGIGGLVGIGHLFLTPSALERIGAASFFMVLYVVSMLAAWWLWNGEQRGITLSKTLWAGQIPGLILGHLGWKFISGLGVSLVFMFHDLGFSATVAFEISQCLIQYPRVVSFEINILAIGVLVYLIRATKTLSWQVVDKNRPTGS
jgi:hypothetical protein